MKTIIKKRDLKTDILRAIAITCIILGHSQPSSLVFEIRNFNVILMMVLLGNSFYISSHKKDIQYLNYVKKRFQRLVVPAWTFLTFFFCFFYFISVAFKEKYYFSFSKIITSYTLTSGIGYVWIIKVFFIVAVVSPFILKVSERIKSNTRYYLLLASSYVVYAFLIFINDELSGIYSALDNVNHYLDGFVRTTYTEFIIYGFSYSLIVAFGIRLSKLSRQEVTYACLLFLCIFLLLGYQNNFSQIQAFKYPPRLYYISFGLFVSLLLYRLLDYSLLRKYLDNKLVQFLSRTSAWIYFWHIIFVYLIRLFGKSLPSIIADTSSGRFLFIMLATLLVTYVHQQIKGIRKDYAIKGVIPAKRQLPQPANI